LRASSGISSFVTTAPTMNTARTRARGAYRPDAGPGRRQARAEDPGAAAAARGGQSGRSMERQPRADRGGGGMTQILKSALFTGVAPRGHQNRMLAHRTHSCCSFRKDSCHGSHLKLPVYPTATNQHVDFQRRL
jgi:hypothetical protein